MFCFVTFATKYLVLVQTIVAEDEEKEPKKEETL